MNIEEWSKMIDEIASYDKETKEYYSIVTLSNSIYNYQNHLGNKMKMKDIIRMLLEENSKVTYWDQHNFNREKYLLDFCKQYHLPGSESYDVSSSLAYDDENAYRIFNDIQKYKEKNDLTWKQALSTFNY